MEITIQMTPPEASQQKGGAATHIQDMEGGFC